MPQSHRHGLTPLDALAASPLGQPSPQRRSERASTLAKHCRGLTGCNAFLRLCVRRASEVASTPPLGVACDVLDGRGRAGRARPPSPRVQSARTRRRRLLDTTEPRSAAQIARKRAVAGGGRSGPARLRRLDSPGRQVESGNSSGVFQWGGGQAASRVAHMPVLLCGPCWTARLSAHSSLAVHPVQAVSLSPHTP